MKILNKAILTGACVMALNAFAAPAPASNNNTEPAANNSPDISGNYQCQGYDPYGKSNYANPVTITRNGNTFTFQWLTTKGYPFILGTGVFNTDLNNAVSVVFWDPKKADYFGTEIFVIKPDGSMSANWTLQGENQVGTESCTKKS